MSDELTPKTAQTQTLNRSPHPDGYIFGQLPAQGAPVTPADPNAIATAPKPPGPTGKPTPDQAFVDPKGRPFDADLPSDGPSITPASGAV
jgi:hypothetical protein